MSNNANDDGANETNYSSSSEQYKGEDQKDLIPTKAKEIGQSLKEKVKSVGKKTEEKTKELKDKSMQTTGIGPAKAIRIRLIVQKYGILNEIGQELEDDEPDNTTITITVSEAIRRNSGSIL